MSDLAYPIFGFPDQPLGSNREKLDASFAGREFDESLLTALPEGVDPCGENGEFHSFVYAGPMLSEDIPVSVGESVTESHGSGSPHRPGAGKMSSR
jgi:diphthamide synthase (EF-2-diphthine--ammonia ligase)